MCFILMYIEAVHRNYESRRRIFNDDKPERKEKAMKSKKDSRKKGRRKKVCIVAKMLQLLTTSC